MLQASRATVKKFGTLDQQPAPQHPIVSLPAEPSRPTPSRPPPFVGASPMFPPGTIPPGLNHVGPILLGHYPTGQIPLLFPPLRVFSVPVMASLVLPNMTLGIPVWYIDHPANILPGQPRPCHALTLIQPFPITHATASMPLQPQQEPTPFAKASLQGGKANRKDLKEKSLQALPSPKAPNPTPPCTLCQVVGHATNSCPKLCQLKPLVHEAFLESNIFELHDSLLVRAKKLKTLPTNHPCVPCDLHGHYSHCFPCFNEFCDYLRAIYG